MTQNHSIGETMDNIKKALSAKAEKILDAQMNYRRFGVLTRRQFCEKMFELGAIPSIDQVPAVQYNRRKFNRMDYAEQREYEKQLAKTKVEYHLYYPDDPDTCAVVTKTEYDYFMSLLAAKEDKADQEYWDRLPDTDKAMINGLFGK